MNGLELLWPEMVLAGLALGLLVLELLIPGRRGKLYLHLAVLFGTVVFCMVASTLSGTGSFGAGTLWAADPLSQFFKLLILGATVLALALGIDYRGLDREGHEGPFAALMLFSCTGLMLLVSATDLLLAFIALELVSISSFILTGYERRDPKSNEGAMKYFIFGAFSSAVMAYGISFYYGATGGTSLTGAAGASGPLLVLGLLFVLVGFGFKASIAPMHFWVPDAYEGAPTPVTAFLSIAPKIATLGALVRILTILLPARSLDLTTLLSILAGLTMTVGNFTAMFQTNIKRLLAYSSVAQAGYILIGVVTGDATGTQGVLLYSLVYVAMNIAAFAVAIAVATDHADAADPYSLDSFDGLAGRSLPMAMAMVICLLSLAGIPPMAGFIAKFYLFSSAIQAGYYGLAVLGVLNSVVSVYYYMAVSYRMFFVAPRRPAALEPGPFLTGGIILATAAVLLVGIYPGAVLAGVQACARTLP